MKVVSEKANTLKFKQYIEGSLPSPPQPNLAAGIDENIRLLSVLCSEMSKFVDRIEILQDTLKLKFKHSSEMQSELQQEEEEGGKHHGSTWEQAANDALLAAVTVDALKQDLVLIVSSMLLFPRLQGNTKLKKMFLIFNFFFAEKGGRDRLYSHPKRRVIFIRFNTKCSPTFLDKSTRRTLELEEVKQHIKFSSKVGTY